MSVVGKFYCNNSPSQGNSCIEIIDANHSIYSNPAHPVYPAINQVWIPCEPILMSVDAWNNMVNTLPPDQVPALYNTKKVCEDDCGNHYVQNCWDFDNGSTVVGRNSFYHLTTSQKNSFCKTCHDDTGDTIIKGHPYCWCVNPQTGGTHSPFGSEWTKPPKTYTCNPEDSGINLETADPLSKKLFLTVKIPLSRTFKNIEDGFIELNEVSFEQTGLVKPINTSQVDFEEFTSSFNNEVFVGNNKIGRYTITAINDYYFEEVPLVNITEGDGLRYDITESNLIYNDNKQLMSITFDVSYNCLEDDDNFIHNNIEFIHSLSFDRGTVEVAKVITQLIVPNKEAYISSGGETKQIKIYGTPKSKFSLTINDSSGCSVLEEELENISIKDSGIYTINQLFPQIDSGLKYENYTINISTTADTENYVTSNTVLHQYSNPTITITKTTSQSGPALTVSGDDVTFIGKAGEEMGFQQAVKTYSLTITENPSTAGYFYVDGGASLKNNASKSTVIKKVVSNENITPTTTSRLKLKPKTTRVDMNGVITGTIESGMYFSKSITHTKTVRASIGKTGCSNLTDEFTLTNTQNLFEGMIVRGEGINTVIASIDNETDITLATKEIARNESILTFYHQVGGVVRSVIKEIDNQGFTHVDMGSPQFIPNNTEISFQKDGTFISENFRISGSGSNTISIAAYLSMLVFGIEDVTYTLNLDSFITRKPNAYNQEIIATKNTNSIINVKKYDRDENVESKQITIVKSPSHGDVAVSESTPYPVTYTPHNGFTGEDSFTFTVSDGTTSSDEKRVFITVKR